MPRTPHLRALPAMDNWVAPNSTSFGAPSALATSHPVAFAAWLRLSMSFRVAPVPSSSGFAGDPISRLPRISRLRRFRCWCLRVSPRHCSPDAPPGATASYPASSTFRLCLGFRAFELPRTLSPLAPADGFPSSPGFAHPPASPSLRLRVAPVPASTAGLMMTSRFPSNFASSDEPRMNLRG